jgi:hypothetical protein
MIAEATRLRKVERSQFVRPTAVETPRVRLESVLCARADFRLSGMTIRMLCFRALRELPLHAAEYDGVVAAPREARTIRSKKRSKEI